MPRGAAAEAIVERELAARGFTILERRLRLGPLEIDLLARRGDLVVLVEVRGRRAGGWIGGLESVGPAKAARLRRAARSVWSQRFADDPSIRALRIDLAAVEFAPNRAPQVEYVEGAIDLTDP